MSTETSTHPDGFEHDHTPVDPQDKVTPCTECPVILEWVGPDRDDFAPIDGSEQPPAETAGRTGERRHRVAEAVESALHHEKVRDGDDPAAGDFDSCDHSSDPEWPCREALQLADALLAEDTLPPLRSIPDRDAIAVFRGRDLLRARGLEPGNDAGAIVTGLVDALAAAEPEPTGGTTVRVTTTPDTVLRHAWGTRPPEPLRGIRLGGPGPNPRRAGLRHRREGQRRGGPAHGAAPR